MSNPANEVKELVDLMFRTNNPAECGRAGMKLMEYMINPNLPLTKADREYTEKVMTLCLESKHPEWKQNLAQELIRVVHNPLVVYK